MRLGKLSIRVQDHETLGRVYVIETSNTDLYEIFLAEGDSLTLRITPETMMLLSEFVDLEEQEYASKPGNA